MGHPDYNSPTELKKFMNDQNMAMQKKFGQNFLVNEEVRKRLIDSLEIDSSSRVWEVGPGLGSMTSEILSRGADLTVFEIDRGFISALKEFFKIYINSGRLHIVEGDILKTWQPYMRKTECPDRFFGNLPYNIAASIVGSTIEQGVRFEKGVITVQKEVAQRMTAAAGTPDYSSFSVLCQWAYTIHPLLDLAAGNFWPQPNVTSRAVEFRKKNGFPACKNPVLFMKMQRSLFLSRRKTIKNNLSKFLKIGDKAAVLLASADINPQVRAEVLSVEQLLLLSDKLNDAIIMDKV
jgi:16S rRNA (adenine1518-N6/adenine1519-N6)-dimethyltransferase